MRVFEKKLRKFDINMLLITGLPKKLGNLEKPNYFETKITKKPGILNNFFRLRSKVMLIQKSLLYR